MLQDVIFVTPAVKWTRGGQTDQHKAERVAEGSRAQSPGGEQERRDCRQLELGAQELERRHAQELERRHAQELERRHAQKLEVRRAEEHERRLRTQQLKSILSAQEPGGLQLRTQAFGIPSGCDQAPGFERPTNALSEL